MYIPLRAIREQLGVTQEALGRAVCVTRQTIAARERGESSPTLVQLFALAKALEVPVQVLLQSEGLADVSLLFRADQPEALTPTMRATCAARASDYAELERLVGEIPCVPPASPTDAYDPAYVEEVAGRIRDWLGVDDGPLTNVVDRLEALGLKILFEKLPPEISGFSACTDQWGAVVVINRDHPGERQAFTALHELGHLVFHRQDYSSSRGMTPGKRDPREKTVQHFAAAVLLPSGLLQRELRWWRGKWLPEPLLLDIKRRCHVSMRTILLRAGQIGMISGEQAGKQVGALNRKYGHDQEPEQLPSAQESARLRRLVFTALIRDLISISRGAELLRLSVPETRNELRRWLEAESL